MLAMFDHEAPMPEKVKSITMYRGSLEDLLVYLQLNPKCRGVFLSDVEPAFELEDRARRIHEARGYSPELNLSMCYYSPDMASPHVGNMLNYNANKVLPLPLVVVTDVEKWANLWGEAALVFEVINDSPKTDA